MINNYPCKGTGTSKGAMEVGGWVVLGCNVSSHMRKGDNCEKKEKTNLETLEY
jgi:hypothetical protein